MGESRRDLNDAFVPAPEVLEPGERKNYVPGDVDREKIYAAWDRLFRSKGKSLPNDVEGLVDLADSYVVAGLELSYKGVALKAQGYAYFAALLGLRAAMIGGLGEKDLKMRTVLRNIERRFCEDELLPKLPTAK